MSGYECNGFEIKSEYLCPPTVAECVCCKSREGVLLPLTSCAHSSLICNFFMLEIKLADLLLCIYCHAFLKKIDEFKKNLELNLHLMNVMAPEVKLNRFSNLSFTNISFISTIDYYNHRIDNDIGDLEDSILVSGESSDTIDQDEFDHDLVMNENTIIREENVSIEIPNIIIGPIPSFQLDHSYCDEVTIKKKKKLRRKKGFNKKITRIKKPKAFRPPPMDVKTVKCKSKRKTSKELKFSKNKPEADKKYSGTIVQEGVFGINLTMEELLKEREEARLKECYSYPSCKCETSIVAFDYEEDLMKHIIEKHTPMTNGFTCDICKTVLENFPTYQSHVKDHTRRLIYDYRDKGFNKKTRLKSHIEFEHPEFEEYKCDLCGKVCLNKRTLKQHLIDLHEILT